MENRVELLRRPLRNLTCPYCGAELATLPATKDHVVGRRFVPKGTLHQSLNVILKACEPCNNRKSDLEDDISAISMLPDLTRGFAGRGNAVAAEAVRKSAKSVSRLTRKRVADSSQDMTFGGKLLPGLTMSFTMTAPPQLNEARVYELAHYQVRGFFYALTYTPDTQRGGCWPGAGFFPVMFSARADWGNPVQLWFMQTVVDWHDRVIGYFADGHFHVAIRRHPTAEVWSWALEWNRSTRVVGFCGDQGTVMEIAKSIPDVPMQSLGRSSDDGELRMRIETPLGESDDCLFYIHESPPPG